MVRGDTSITWGEYVQALIFQFGVHTYDDPHSYLTNLKHPRGIS